MAPYPFRVINISTCVAVPAREHNELCCTHMTFLTRVYLPVVIILFSLLLYAPFALAQDVQTDADVQVSGGATVPQPFIKPLDALKARAKEIKQGAMDARIDLRADTKVRMQNATTSGERKDILKGAAGARVDIMKDRKASSTDLRGDVKALIRWHGGLIKQRFVLAIRHFNNILTRIDTRLDKLQSEGVNTDAVAKMKVDAEVAIDKAEVDAKAVADFVATVPDESDRATVRAELNSKIKTAQESIKAAHTAVQKVVRGLVDLVKNSRPKASVDVNASTTVNTSN